MALSESANVGRKIFWTQKGIDALGGGFLGVIIASLFERKAKRNENKPAESFFEKVADKIIENIEGQR